jgi:hypothetical protein
MTAPRPAVLAVAVAAALVLGAPLLGEVRGQILSLFPESYRSIMWAAVLTGSAGLVAACIAAIRDRHAPRYLVLVAAVAVGVVCEALLRTGDANVDAVEAFHFVEYAAVTWVCYRVWRSRADPSSLVLPGVAALIVGLCDEWFQWFVPLRAGEARDVAMDGLAVVSGLLFCVAIDPPTAFDWRGRPGSWWRMGGGVAGLLLIGAAFTTSVHVGHAVVDSETGRMWSWYTAGELDTAARDRAARWALAPPVAVARMSREDQYLGEGVAHVRWRNQALDRGDLTTAWHENLILERYFAPVLDHPSYATGTVSRWAPHTREDVAARAPRVHEYDSAALPVPLYEWPPLVVAGGALAAAMASVACGAVAERRPHREGERHG